MQEIIVILIVTTAALAVVRHYYRQLTKKDSGCNCCPHSGGECHCHGCNILE
ncbi:MAG: hypothetical protein IJV06_10470 [Bacteroidaceae bacterium]|nr:hypothetical protein [Bacteroidaceae bacterium]